MKSKRQTQVSTDMYTVVGFWPDSLQRFCTHVQAPNANQAEAICVAENFGLAICGVLKGELHTLESAQLVQIDQSSTRGSAA